MKLDKNTKIIALAIAAIFLLKDKIFAKGKATQEIPQYQPPAIIINTDAYKEKIRTLQGLIKTDIDGIVGPNTLRELAKYTKTIPSTQNINVIILVVKSINIAIAKILKDGNDIAAKAYMAQINLDFNKYIPGSFENLKGISLTKYLDAYKTGAAGSW